MMKTSQTVLTAVLGAAAFTGSANAAAIIDYLDAGWTGSGNTRTQTIDIDGISTIVTLTGASSIGPGNLTLNPDAGFGGFGVDTGPDGIHGNNTDGALESITISLAPVSGSAIYTFESVSMVGIGANTPNGTTTMNVGSETIDVGTGSVPPGGSGDVIQTANFSQVTNSLVIDFNSSTDTDAAGAFWRSVTVSAVPEPSSLALLALGGGLMLHRRRA